MCTKEDGANVNPMPQKGSFWQYDKVDRSVDESGADQARSKGDLEQPIHENVSQSKVII